MISCIICSRQPDIPAELKENIASTIGCEYELVGIDNSKNEYSIFSAYNEGVRRAKGEILCFMHEDVFFHSNEWGKLVESYFTQNPKVGLLGVAGGHYLSSYPHGWWETETRSGHLIQGFLEDGVYKKLFTLQEEALKNAGLVNKTLDGVKVLAHGDITKKFTVKVNAYSDAAKAKIEAAGGKAEVI